MAAIVGDVKEIVLVTPSEPTPSHIVSLSAIDSQLLLRFTIEYCLSFRCSNKTSSSKSSFTASRIKDALSQVLVPYYPLAGRLRSHTDGMNIEVVCRAQGAMFVEAVSDMSVSDFEHAPSFPNQWRDLLMVQVADVLRGGGDPLLVVQLTWLANGDAAIAMGLPHCVSDGIGGAEFLNSFVNKLVTETCKHTDLKPVWERHLLNPTPLKVRSSIKHLEFDKVQDLSGFISRFSSAPVSPTLVTFDNKSLTELKRIASSITVSPTYYTSFEVLSAHVWRSWARSLDLPSKQMVKVLFPINIRKIVKPNLPEGYYGNGLVLRCAQTNVKELTDNGLWYAAGLVKKAKERVNDEHVKSVIQAVSSEARACPDLVGTLLLSQWSRLGFDNVDFGWGKHVHVGPVCYDKCGLLLPVYEQKDAMKVMLAVPEIAAEKYQYLLRNPCN